MQKTDAIRVAALERLLARCAELSDREKTLVTGMSTAVVSKLLSSMVGKINETTTTNEAQALSYARMVDELFDLNLADGVAELCDT